MGGGGDMGGGLPDAQPQSFNIWTKVKLATEPVSAEKNGNETPMK
jgi:hypothetical protein